MHKYFIDYKVIYEWDILSPLNIQILRDCPTLHEFTNFLFNFLHFTSSSHYFPEGTYSMLTSDYC